MNSPPTNETARSTTERTAPKTQLRVTDNVSIAAGAVWRKRRVPRVNAYLHGSGFVCTSVFGAELVAAHAQELGYPVEQAGRFVRVGRARLIGLARALSRDGRTVVWVGPGVLLRTPASRGRR